jgi:hypothetical protein
MPVWLSQIVARVVAAVGIKELQKWIEYGVIWLEMKKRKARQDQAEETIKEELKKAGNDEQAQKDAIDKFFDSTR